MAQRRRVRNIEVTDLIVHKVLRAPKWIDAMAAWTSMLPPTSVVQTATVHVNTEEEYPLQLRCTWNTMDDRHYEYALHLTQRRISAVDVGRVHKQFKIMHENFWKNGNCSSARLPQFVSDPSNVEKTFREYLEYTNITYKGPFPWSKRQKTLDGRLILDELFGRPSDD